MEVQYDYGLEALVLGKRDYPQGREGTVAPSDLALGWGPLLDPQMAAKVSVTQADRKYRWRTSQYHEGLGRRDIERNSAKTHLILANEQVRSVINRVERFDRIRLQGYLVNVYSTLDDWHWTTSTSRNDTGDGACELMYVESAEILPPP